jgi:hypothetical protein
LLWREGHPDIAGGYLLAASAVSLLCLTILSGGGKTYGTWERQEKATVATTRITGGRWSSRAIVLVLAALIVAIPVVIGLLRPDDLPAVLAVETVILSVVLALEGIREYRLFSKRFRRLNSRLPRDERSPKPAAGPSSART